MSGELRHEIGIYVYLFLPVAISIIVFLFGDGFKRRISSGLSILFAIVCWLYVCKVTTGNPGYMFPALHVVYPIVCTIALVAFFILELVFWHIIQRRRINRLKESLQLLRDSDKTRATDFIAQMMIDDDGRVRITPRTQSFPAIQKAYDDILWNDEQHCLCSAKPYGWEYLKGCRHIVKGVKSVYGCTLTLHPETNWINFPSWLKSEVENWFKKRS